LAGSYIQSQFTIQVCFIYNSSKSTCYLLSLNSQSRLLNIQPFDWLTAHRLSANNPAFYLIRKFNVLSRTAALLLLGCQRFVENYANKIQERLLKLKTIIALPLVGYELIIIHSVTLSPLWFFYHLTFITRKRLIIIICTRNK